MVGRLYPSIDALSSGEGFTDTQICTRFFTDAALRWTRAGGVVASVWPNLTCLGSTTRLSEDCLRRKRHPAASISSASAAAYSLMRSRRRCWWSIDGAAHALRLRRSASSASIGRVRRRCKTAAHLRRQHIEKRRGCCLVELMRFRFARRLRSMPQHLSDYGYMISTGPLVWNRHKRQLRQKHSAGAYPIVWAELITSNGRFVWRSEKRNHAPWLEAELPKDRWLIISEGCVLLQRTTAKEQARRLIAAEMPRSFVERHRGVVVENHLNMVRASGPSPGVPPSAIAALLNCAVVDFGLPLHQWIGCRVGVRA